jgi:hypothetical protein
MKSRVLSVIRKCITYPLVVLLAISLIPAAIIAIVSVGIDRLFGKRFKSGSSFNKIFDEESGEIVGWGYILYCIDVNYELPEDSENEQGEVK